MSSGTEGLSPDIATPLLANPAYQERLTIVVNGISVMPVEVGRLEYTIADRFGCGYTREELPYLTFSYGSTWEAIDREYRKACITQPRKLYMSFDLTDETAVFSEYVLPLAALGRDQQAVIMRCAYEAKAVERPKQTLRMLGRKTLKGARVDQNPYYVPRPPVNPEDSHSITEGSIRNKAISQGHLGAR